MFSLKYVESIHMIFRLSSSKVVLISIKNYTTTFKDDVKKIAGWQC